MNARNILLLCPSRTRGGAERVVQTLACRLAARGARVRAILPSGPGVEATLEWFADAGAAADASPALRDYMEPRGRADIAALRRLVRDSGADAVNLHYPVNWISLKDVLAVRLAGIRRCVATVHSPIPVQSGADRQQINSTRLAARLCRAVTVVSDWSRAELCKIGIPARKIRVIPNGVRLPPAPPSRGEARGRLGLPERSFVIAGMGRLAPEKDFASLIHAVADLPSGPGGVRLVIGGDGPLRADLEALAEARLPGRVHFLGHVGDVEVVYAAADVFALATRAESFGLAFVEAALHGLPSVSSRVGAVPETVLDGRTGLLVPPCDPAALAAALGRLHDDPDLRRRLGEAARARARAEFLDDVMAARYEQVLFSGRGA